MGIAGKTILLTGSSSGIGAEAACQLAAAGATVLLAARREDELRQVQARIAATGGRAFIYPCDLTDDAAVTALVARVLAEHPGLDVLVNNAARSIRRPITEALDRLHDYERTLQINFLAAVNLTLKLLPHFLAQGRGQVVNISTMSTQVPIPLFSAYLASKSALESFSRSLSAELGDRGIAVTVVYFPMVRTQMSGKTAIYQHMRMMDAAAAAGWIVKAVDEAPARVSSPLGAAGQVLLAALPGPVVALTRPFFRRMDRKLAQKLKRD